MRRTLATAAMLLWAASCGDTVPEPDRGPARASVVADAGERIVVATVDGRPVYGDCVAARARELSLSRDAALRECIDFELLAARAERAGFADHADVVMTGEREAVRALLEREFEPTFDGPDDVDVAQVRKVWKRPAVFYSYNHDEYRSSHFVRVPVAESEPRDGAADRAARDVARRIADAVEGRSLDADQFREQAIQAAAGAEVTVSDKPYTGSRDRTDPGYGDAVFAMKAVGDTTRPVRTRWGWDVILLMDIKPAQSNTFEQAEADLRKQVFPSAQAKAFETWVDALVAERQVVIYEERLPAGGAMVGIAPGLAPSMAPDGPPAGLAAPGAP